jgi:hypothetical protein
MSRSICDYLEEYESPTFARTVAKALTDETVATLAGFSLCYARVLRMHGIRRQTLLIVLLGIALCAPLFEAIDNSNDLEQGTDLVFVFLMAFVSIGLFTLCRRIVLFLRPRLLDGAISSSTAVFFPNRSIPIEIVPSESPPAIGPLRI